MPQKKHKPEEIGAKLRQVDVLLSQGRPVAEAIRTISVTAFTYYRWRKEFGGLKTCQVKRLKGGADCGHGRACHPIRTLRLSPDRSDAARVRLGGEHQTR